MRECGSAEVRKCVEMVRECESAKADETHRRRVRTNPKSAKVDCFRHPGHHRQRTRCSVTQARTGGRSAIWYTHAGDAHAWIQDRRNFGKVLLVP